MTPRLYHNKDGSVIIREPDKYRDLVDILVSITPPLAVESNGRKCVQYIAWALGTSGFPDVCEAIMEYAGEPEPLDQLIYYGYLGG